MRFPRLTLAVAGVIYVAIGLAFLVNPQAMAEFVLLRPAGPSLVAIRAVDGGLELGLGVFFLVAGMRERWTRAGLGGVILGCGGLALGRGIGMLLEGRLTSVHAGFMALELLGVAVGTAAFGRARAAFEASRIDRRRAT